MIAANLSFCAECPCSALTVLKGSDSARDTRPKLSRSRFGSFAVHDAQTALLLSSQSHPYPPSHRRLLLPSADQAIPLSLPSFHLHSQLVPSQLNPHSLSTHRVVIRQNQYSPYRPHQAIVSQPRPAVVLINSHVRSSLRQPGEYKQVVELGRRFRLRRRLKTYLCLRQEQ